MLFIRRALLNWPGAIAWLAVVATAGCGGANGARVSGTVVDAQGAPIADARVVARQDDTAAWASGVTDQEGRFKLGTERPNEPIPTGEYAVVLTDAGGDWERSGPPKVSKKYESASTSGIRFVASAGEDLVLDIRLDPP